MTLRKEFLTLVLMLVKKDSVLEDYISTKKEKCNMNGANHAHVLLK